MNLDGLRKQITAGHKIMLNHKTTISKWIIYIKRNGSSFCVKQILHVLMCRTLIHQEYKGIILGKVLWYPKKA
jgi:hypothetical protein